MSMQVLNKWYRYIYMDETGAYSLDARCNVWTVVLEWKESRDDNHDCSVDISNNHYR